MELTESLQKLKQLDEKISAYSSVLSLSGWDSKVMAPKKGRKTFANAIGIVSTEVFKLRVSDDMGNLLAELTKPDIYNSLEDKDQALVRKYNHSYSRNKSIPTHLYQEYSVLTGEANQVWEEARANNDFTIYQPYLEKMVEFKRKFAEYYGYEDHPYDALMDDFEPGLKVKDIDPIFQNLRRSSVNLLEKIIASNVNLDRSFLQQDFEIKKQKAFLHNLLPKLGYDTEAGRLDATAHPFANKVNRNDVRITTRYDKNNLSFALFSTIHEVGHALYEQGVSEDLEGTALNRGVSLGIHESQSRFLENMVARTPEFWQAFYSDLQATFSDQLKNVSSEQFYRASNSVQPSLIRVEADELTYNLHIMIRYEIEKGLIAGDIEVKDLPQIWNDKMEEYLGIRPETDSVGVLQDVHWSFGAIGYFHTYTLGNLYAAQILNTIQKKIPDFYKQISQGNLLEIREWLREQIHQHGSIYQPIELIQKVTGEKLNADYLVNYLEDKYSKLYNLK